MVEGFSTPLSNKRTAGLPNPHPTGQQSCCSVVLGSPPLGLRQATALCQTHTRRDTWPSAMPPDPQPPWSPPPVRARLQPRPGPTAHQDTSPSPEPTTLQALLSPGYDRTPPLRHNPPIRPCRAPAPCAITGAQPAGIGTSLARDSRIHQPARNLALGRSRPQFYRLPR
jgi:hypothetical protein